MWVQVIVVGPGEFDYLARASGVPGARIIATSRSAGQCFTAVRRPMQHEDAPAQPQTDAMQS